MSSVFPITDDPRYRRYTASEGQTVFAISFPFQQNDDVSVFTAAQNVLGGYIKVSPTAYSLSGAGEPVGGSLAFLAPRKKDDEILIVGDAVLDRLSSIVRDGKFSSALTDGELDRVRLIQQELRRETNRALKSEYGATPPRLSRKMTDGGSLVLRGDEIVSGPDPDVEKAEREAMDQALASLIAQGGSIEVPVFDSATALTLANVKPTINSVRTSGFRLPGDNGAGLYMRVPSLPVHDGWVRSSDGAYWQLADIAPHPEQFGARGDGFDDVQSLINWKNFCQLFSLTGRVLGRSYLCSSNPAFGSGSGMTMLAEKGAQFKGPISHDPGIRVLGENEIDVWNYDPDNGIDNHYRLTPGWQKAATLKDVWLGGELDHSRLRAVNLSTEGQVIEVGYTADSFNPASAVALLPDAVALGLTAGAYKVIMLPSTGASELSAVWDPDADFSQVVVIRTSKGWYNFRAQGNGNGGLGYKPAGGAYSEINNIEWLGRFYHQSYQAINALWTIRNENGRSFSILINQKEVWRQEVDGFITDWGFGGASASAKTIAIRDITLRTGLSEPSGLACLDIVTAGDSFSAPAHGGWQAHFERALHGQLGIEVRSLQNIAISGANSGGVLAQVTSFLDQADANGRRVTDVIAMFGINDQQQMVDRNLLKSNVAAIKSRAMASKARLHLVLQPPHYPQDLTTNNISPFNYKAVGLYRAALLRAAAENNIAVIDMMARMPRVQQDQLLDASLDPGVFDLIHPTTYARKEYGYHIARGVLANLAWKFSTAIKPQLLPVWGYMSGWSAHARSPKIGFDTQGNVRLSGLLAAGAKAAGTAIFRLPANARPETEMLIEVYGQYSARVILNIAQDGTIYLATDLTPGGDTFIALDGVEFSTAIE